VISAIKEFRMATERTTEHAELMFDIAFKFIDRHPNRNKEDGQYYLYMALGMKDLSKAVREVYDKLDSLEKKLSLGR
jgi:hypothetical protein